MNWRIGVSRIILVISGLWILLIFGAAGPHHDNYVMSDMLEAMFIPVIALVILSQLIVWIVEGFSDGGREDHY